MIVVGVIILLFPLYNWVNYNLIYQSQQDQFVGKYRNKESGYYINLYDDGRWQSNHNEFESNSGTWEFIMTEDMNYIELAYKGREYGFLQIYSYDESYIEFSSDENRGGNKMQLRFEKRKNQTQQNLNCTETQFNQSVAPHLKNRTSQ